MLRLARMPIDTGAEPVCFVHRACTEIRAEPLLSAGKVEIVCGERRMRCTLNLVEDTEILAPDALGLSRRAFEEWGAAEGAPVGLHRAPEPASRPALRAKVGGAKLSAAQIDAIIADIGLGRYTGREIAGFLISASHGLDDEETIALAHSRARHAHRLAWTAPMVVDKHSIGGLPGTRVSMVVVPIVIAAGLTMPKTASRAITSAAGTADAMEVLARVDLDAGEVARAVEAVGGCIVWNGRLSHSPVDEVMNALTRPLGVESHRLSVASIVSKKVAAGSTHVVIDIPVGRTAKVRSNIEAAEIARLFRLVAEALGLSVAVEITDGSQPVGRGIGPALEARDAMAVLSCGADAPADLRAKSLMLAARILGFDTRLDGLAALTRATELLDGGHALAVMNRLIDAQGRNPSPPAPGALGREIEADRAGRIKAIDCFRISGIARRAGAPSDKAAGIDLFRRVGDMVAAGEPLYRIHTTGRDALDEAVAYAASGSGLAIVVA